MISFVSTSLDDQVLLAHGESHSRGGNSSVSPAPSPGSSSLESPPGKAVAIKNLKPQIFTLPGRLLKTLIPFLSICSLFVLAFFSSRASRTGLCSSCDSSLNV